MVATKVGFGDAQIISHIIYVPRLFSFSQHAFKNIKQRFLVLVKIQYLY